MSRTTRKRAQSILSRSVNDRVAKGGGKELVQAIDTSDRLCLLVRPSLPNQDATLGATEPQDALEHGYVTGKATLNEPALDDPNNRRRLMSAFSIQYDGRYYRYCGYRYDRLADAVAYSQLMQSQPPQHDVPPPLTHDHQVEAPSARDRTLMDALSITFKAGVYEYDGFHYDRLADAVDYAQMRDATSG